MNGKDMRQDAYIGAACALLSVLSAGCSGQMAEDPAAIEQRTLCGANDMQEVEQYNGTLGPSVQFVAGHQAPVGMFKWRADLASRYTNPGDVSGEHWCTGTMINARQMLTAGHCFDIDSNGWTWPRVNATNTPITSAQGATEMLVDFNYQLDPMGNPRTVTTVAVTSLAEYRLGGLDYAVVTLAGTPGLTFGKTVPAPFRPKVADAVTIVQHPAGALKKIHAGPVASLTTNTVSYATADTLGGSSGSGVLNNVTGYISAVHTNGGCQSDGSGANVGVLIDAIWKSSPIVRAMSLDTAKIVTLL